MLSALRSILRLFNLYFVIALLLASFGLYLICLPSPHKIVLYWMPKCPFGISALKEALSVKERYGRDVSINFVLIGTDLINPGNVSRPDGIPLSGGSACENVSRGRLPFMEPVLGRFVSLHGKEEVLEGMRITAITNLWPQNSWDIYVNP